MLLKSAKVKLPLPAEAPLTVTFKAETLVRPEILKTPAKLPVALSLVVKEPRAVGPPARPKRKLNVSAIALCPQAKLSASTKGNWVNVLCVIGGCTNGRLRFTRFVVCF